METLGTTSLSRDQRKYLLIFTVRYVYTAGTCTVV